MRQPSPRARTTEARMHKSTCSATGEAAAVGNPALHLEGIPHSPQLEQACVQQQRPSAAK